MPLITDPRDLLLDDENDLVVTTDLQFSTGIEAVMQSCRIVMQMFKGEWFLDLDIGIPYWGEILGKKPHVAIAAATASFQDALGRVDGVLKVLQLDVVYTGITRLLTVTWRVSTEFGDTSADTLELSVGGS